MRLFAAILLSPDMVSALCRVQDALRRRGVEGNYTRAENLHLTLAFIGDYPDPDAVLEALGELRFAPFRLELDGLGAFGELWWAGLKESRELDALVRRLRHALADAGIPFDRKPFRPHITLIRKPCFPRRVELASVELPQTASPVERVSLMLSTRGRAGMIYTELGSIPANRAES